MNNVIMDGRALARKIKAQAEKKVAALGRRPWLHVIQVGDDPASSMYVRSKQRDCEECGIHFTIDRLSEKISQRELMTVMNVQGKNSSVTGLLVQLPLPPHIDKAKVFAAIPPEKDVDCLNPVNAGRFYSNAFATNLKPCTPAGVMELLREYGIETVGKKAVVLGRSDIVGAPVAKLLRDGDATVSVCHSRTPHRTTWELCRNADILVAAVGVPGFVTEDLVKPGATVIDVGIHAGEDGRIVSGDVDPAAFAMADYYTPVPGGVGPMTRAMLIRNVVELAERSVP